MNEMIAQTNAYLAACYLSDDLKWTRREPSVRVSLRLRDLSFLSDWDIVERVLIIDGRIEQTNN